MDTPAPLDIAHDGPIARLTLNRPDMRNAFDDTLIAALTGAVQAAAEDPAVRVLLLTGAGKAFCAGGDLNWMRKMATLTDAENRADAAKLARMLHTIWSCPKPVVACVNGDAYAGGMGPGPENPLGPRALYLYKNGADTLFRIHGTTEPYTIGTNVSSGCIRLMNQDIIDLYARVPVGARVTVIN